MKIILAGQAQRLKECVAFVTDRCKAHELNPNVEPMKEGTGVIIRCPLSFLMCCKVSIFTKADDLIVESVAGNGVIFRDPAPPPFSNLLGFFYEIPARLKMNRTLKTIHSEIKNQFVNR